MQFLNNSSINTKLLFLVAASVAAALSLSCLAFVINDVHLMRESMVRQLSALGEVLGSNTTAALTFDDSESATQLLSSLQLQSTVESAYIFDAQGDVFAEYLRDDNSSAPPTVPEYLGHEFTSDGYLVFADTIDANGEVLGIIYLRATLDLAYQEMLSYALIVFGVILFSFGAAYLPASRLRGAIAGPILELASAAQQISAKQDYSIRVAKTSGGELGTLFDEFNGMLDKVETSKKELQKAHGELEMRVEKRTRQLSETNRELSVEISERRRAEQELENVHRDLIVVARRAGMAEIATGVLHNVGNVLNSVNVSASMIAGRLRNSKRNHLTRVAAMIEEHRDNLDEYLTTDEKGRQIPTFLNALAGHFEAEEKFLRDETQSLTSNVEHIKTIISTQQSYAGLGGMVEPVNVNELLDDAVRFNATSFARHEIHIERQYADLPTVLIDKHRLLQIVVNLIKNAKESLIVQQDFPRVMTLRTQIDDDQLVVELCDTGIGIRPEDLTRIFSHGFSTKHQGHGFGLHSCANAATEMEGSLAVVSDGPMKGAKFILSLPLVPATAAT